MPLSRSLRLRSSARWPLALLLGLLLLAAPRARAEIQIYAKFLDATGVYMGEVTTPTAYAGWTSLLSMSFGFTNNLNPDGSSPSSGFRPTPTIIGLVRPVDRVSPQLFLNTVTGSVIGGSKSGSAIGLTIVFYNTSNNTEPLRLECKGVAVNSVGSSGSSDLPLESVGIAFSSFRMTVLDSKGNAVVTSWNFAANNSTF